MEVDFDTKLDLIVEYYGSDDILWDRMDITGLSTDEINAMYNSLPTPLYSVDKTPSGINLGRNYSNSFELPVVPGTEFDSNIAGGAYGGGNNFTGNIPANLELDPVTGSPVRQTAGATTAGGTILPTLADRIDLAVMGVNIGAKLGLAIDETLYNINPAWWDENLPTVNPDTWNSLVGVNPTGDFFLRTLFGITGNQMTGYVSEDAVAYYYTLLRDKGVLSNDGEYDVDTSNVDDSVLNMPIEDYDIHPSNSIDVLQNSPPASYPVVSSYVSDAQSTVYWTLVERNTDYYWYGVSDAPFKYSNTANLPTYYNASTVTSHGITYYVTTSPQLLVRKSNVVSVSPSLSTVSPYNIAWEIAYILFHGTVTPHQSVPGFNQLPNATQYPPH